MQVAPVIGILALQGNFAMHEACLNQLGLKPQLITTPQALSAIDALILPGGESSVMLKLMGHNLLWFDRLQLFFAQKKPIFGTCAGIILLAQEVLPLQKSLHFLDVTVARNAYGRQIDSSVVPVTLNLGVQAQQLALTFIRAPKITRVGAGVTVLGRVDDEPVIVQQGHVLGATCHPEASTTVVHQYFLKHCLPGF